MRVKGETNGSLICKDDKLFGICACAQSARMGNLCAMFSKLSSCYLKCVVMTADSHLHLALCRAVMEKISPEFRMSEDTARRYFIDLFLGLEYCECYCMYMRTHVHV